MAGLKTAARELFRAGVDAAQVNEALKNEREHYARQYGQGFKIRDAL